jgi:hypothetical protein
MAKAGQQVKSIQDGKGRPTGKPNSFDPPAGSTQKKAPLLLGKGAFRLLFKTTTR